jgi:hypothetical protein
MSRFFPHAAYAEDQPYGHTILTAHVLSRGFAVGSGVGLVSSLIRHYFRPTPSLRLSLLRGSGNGALIGTGLLAVALVGRMRGREEIEWKDRSWRLLWNRGQVEVDDWWIGGAGLGAVGVAARRELRALGWRGAVGGAGLGSLLGMLGHAGWRYGIKGGFGEEKVV